MAPLYEKYDAFATAAMRPAPRLTSNKTIEFWRKPNMMAPFNITDALVLVTCISYSSGGLPMGMQIAGNRSTK